MTQRLDDVSAPIHSAFKPVDVTCSCTKCDSYYCFAKRHDLGSCSCENCTEPKTCLFYGKSTKKNRTDATNTGPTYRVTSGTGTRRFLWDATTNTSNPSKNTLELYKSMIETSKLKIDALRNAYMSGTYKRDILKNGDPHSNKELQSFDRQRPEPSSYTIELSKTVLETQKMAVEPLKKVYLPSKNENKRDFHTAILETRWDTIDIPMNRFLSKKDICDCSNCVRNEFPQSNYLDGPAGYIFDLPKPETKTNRIEPRTNINRPSGNCNCTNNSKNQNDQTLLRFCVNVIPNIPDLKKYSKDAKTFKYDLCNNILAIQKNIMEKLDSMYSPKEKVCDCEELPNSPSAKQSNPVGYIYEVPKYTQDPTNPPKSHTFMKDNNCTCNNNNISGSESEPRGYVFDLNKHNSTQKCNCTNSNNGLKNNSCRESDAAGYVAFDLNNIEKNEKQQNTFQMPSELPGYVFDLNINNSRNCNCEHGSKNTNQKYSESSGYVFELSKHKDKPIPTTNASKTENCNCDDKSKGTCRVQPDSLGYVFELNEYKYNSREKICCNCGDGPINTTRRQSDIVGYVYELNKYKNNSMPTNNISKKDNYDNVLENIDQALSDSPGYVFGLQKYKHDQIQNYSNCDCKDVQKKTSRKQFELPGYVFELNKLEDKPKDKPIPILPTSDPQQYFNNTTSIINKDSFICDENPKSKCQLVLDSAGYVLDLNNHPHKDSCNCIDTVTNKSRKYSESSGFVFDLNKNKPIPTKTFPISDNCNCGEGPKSKCRAPLDSPGYVFDPNNNNLPHKHSCNCIDAAQNKSQKYSESPGFVFDLNKDKPVSENCNCGEGPKTKCRAPLDSPGYVFDPNNNNLPHKHSCNCIAAAKNKSQKYSESPGFVFDLNKDFPKSENCNCGEGPKSKCRAPLDSPGYVFDPNNNNLPHKHSCNCIDAAKNKSQKYSESPGFVFDLNKDKPVSENCNCGEGPKTKCRAPLDSPGYVFDPNNNNLPHKHSCNCIAAAKNKSQKYSESPGFVFDLNKDKPISDNCNCGEGPKTKCRAPLDSPGYVFDPNNNNLPHKNSCNCIDAAKNKSRKYSESPGFVFDLNKDFPKSENCNCGEGPKSKCRTPLDSPGYVFDLNSNKLPHKNSCNCIDAAKNKSRKYSESPGFVFDLNKDFPKSENCNCGEGPKSKCRTPLDSPGYVFDLNSNKLPHKNSCNCIDAAKNKSRKYSESPGFVFDLNKDFTKSENCNCGDGPKSKCRAPLDSPGYIFDLNNNLLNKDSCNCNDAAKNKPRKYSESPGFVFDLNKDKPVSGSCNYGESPKSKCRAPLDSPGYVFDLITINYLPQKDSCNCNSGPKNIPRRESDSPGYIYELNKYKKETLNCQQQSLNKGDSCNCNSGNKNTSRRHSDTPGYIYELSKYKQETILKNGPRQSFNKEHSCYYNSREKNTSRRHSDSPGYIYELSKYKEETIPKNGPRQSFNKEDSCNCNSRDKNTSRRHSDSPGYIYELSKYKQETIPKNGPRQSSNKEDSCNCKSRQNNTSRRHSDSPGYIYELNKYKQKTVDTNGSQKGDSCNCNSSTKNKSHRESDSSGYIYNLNKFKQTPIHSNNAQQVFNNTNNSITDDRCNCNYGSKNAFRRQSDSPGYVFELNKTKSVITNNQKNCECYSNGYILRLDKYKKKPLNSANNREIFVNRLETQTFAMETFNNNNNQQKKIFECDVSVKCDSELPGYVFHVPKQADNPYCCQPPGNILELNLPAYEPSQNTQELCKSIIETQVDTIQTMNDVFNYPQNDNHGRNESQYQNTLEVYNLSPGKEESCTCPESPRNSTQQNVTNNNIQEIKKVSGSKPISLEELKRIYLPKSSKRMLETPGIQIEKLKEIYLPKKSDESRNNILDESNKTSKLPKNTLDLCKAPKNKIEALKNIYMPPRFTVDYTKKYEHPGTSDSGRNIDDNQTVMEESRKEINPGTAMLTAEIMNMPYTKFNDSLAQKPPKGVKKASTLTKYDILSRIKEAYEACSCKVCECIVGKPVKTTTCNCKPCECRDCTAYLDNSDHSEDDINCPCAQCNKNQCLKAALEMNKLETCDCAPCDCIKCTKVSPNMCICEPCQCDDCKPKSICPPQSYVVAPVGASTQRVACSCSPCDCIECGQTYPLTSSVMHEMSTGTNRHALCRCEVCLNETCDQSGVNACKCERRNRVMSKPVEKDSHDFDIRTATVIQYKPFHHDGKKRNKKHNTIAMFAALPDKYPTFSSTHLKFGNIKTCNCEECECISCVCKEDAINAIKSSQLFSFNKTKTESNLNIYNKSKLNKPKSCECKPCECQICEKYTNNNCDFLDCNSEHRLHKYSRNALCKCSLCECRDCQTKMTNDPHIIVSGCICGIRECGRCFGDRISLNATMNHTKKGEVLTPSTHRVKVNSMILEKDNSRVPSSLMQTLSFNKDNTHTFSKHDYHDICIFDIAHPNKSETFEGNAYIHCQKQFKRNSSLNNDSIDREISGSYFSGYSSFETSPRTSGHKGCGSITSNSRKINKSWESSCNSSGHDYPEYLIQFPKSTVEGCLQDVLELDIDNKFDEFNIIPNNNSTTKYDVDKENLYLNHECNLKDSSDSKVITTNKPGSIKQNNRKNNSNQRTHPCQKKKEKSYRKNNDNKQFQSSGVLKSSISSLRSHSEDRNYFNGNSHKFHSTHKLFDYNVAEEGSTLLPSHNEGYCTWRYSNQLPHPSFINTTDVLNIDEDNKRVQKTLKDAKEFSIELTRLLEMYEKANKEFESISEKLKMSHGSLKSKGFDITKESCSFEEDILEKCIVEENRLSDIENEVGEEVHLEAASAREKSTRSILRGKCKTSERTIMNGENGSNTSLQKLSTYKDILNYQKVREPIAEYDPSPTMNSIFDNNLLEQIETHIKKKEACFESVANNIVQNDERTMQSGYKSDEGIFSEEKNEDIIAPTDNGGTKRKGQINNKNYKKYSKLLKRTIIISKRISMKHSNYCESNPVVKYCVTVGTSTTFVSEINTKPSHERNTLLPVKLSVKDTEECGMQKYRKHKVDQIMNKLSTVFRNIEDVSVCTSTDTCGLNKNLERFELEDAGIHAKVELQKFLRVPTLQSKYPDLRNQSYCTKESLNLQNKNNLELKETPQLPLHKTHKDVKNVDKEALCDYTHGSLEDQMRNLLELYVLLPLVKKHKELDEKFQNTTLTTRISGARSSCETLKVGFLGVRRVSDHTVLVKWNTPRALSKVKGYELLVDGRAVQKIFSPSKCMAVVTCLPHTDKVLLTIRTIVSDVSMTGHYPATTIIYRPRVK